MTKEENGFNRMHVAKARRQIIWCEGSFKNEKSVVMRASY